MTTGRPTVAGEVADELPTLPGLTLERVLGRGRTSTVYCAHGEQGRVAVRLTDPAARPADEVLAEASRHEDVQSLVRGEHLVHLYSTLVLPDGVVALVLDLAEGGSLHELVARRGPLEPGELATTLTPIATALAELHAREIVHGALDPRHVLFTAAGKPVLSHLGAAHRVSELQLAAGEPTSIASDLWSLGAVAWFAATGSPPPPEAAGTAATTLEPALAAVVGGLLDDDPDRRPDAHEAAEAFYRSAVPSPVRLPVRDAGSQLASALRGEAGRTRAAPADSTRPVRPRAVVLAVAVLVVAGIVVGLVRLAGSSSPSPAAAGVVSTSTADPTTTGSTRPTDPKALLQQVVDARAVALTARDTAALAACEAVGSTVARGDAAVIAALTSAGESYHGLTFTVRSASVASYRPGSLEVLAVVDRAAYTVTGPGTTTSAKPVLPGTAYRYGLVDQGSGWRLATVADE